MSKILQLDKSYDLYISYSWGTVNHGICGHTYEVIEYFLLLKNHMKVGILLCEDITWELFESAITDKYNVTSDELQHIKDNTIFKNRPLVVTGNNILFTDGGVKHLEKVKLYFNNILMFACGNKEIKDNNKDNVYVLQDDRVYEPVKKNGINYKKKILFSRFKGLSQEEDVIMLYGTKNCRDINDDTYEQLTEHYDKPFIVLTNEENSQPDTKRMKFLSLPVENLFEKFSTYVYTPVARHFDCSPRFIAECKFYNKEVIYYNIDYWEEDLGLLWRKQDIDHDFASIHLTENDEIINIVKGLL